MPEDTEYGTCEFKSTLMCINNCIFIVCFGFSQWLSSKESTCNAGDIRDMGLIHGSRRSPVGGNGNTLQYSYLENPIDKEDSQAI